MRIGGGGLQARRGGGGRRPGEEEWAVLQERSPPLAILALCSYFIFGSDHVYLRWLCL